jgi:two-component system, cell cycle sensor histidine kinase and response regulator CckA
LHTNLRSWSAFSLGVAALAGLGSNVAFGFVTWAWAVGVASLLWLTSMYLFWTARSRPSSLEQHLDFLSATLDGAPGPWIVSEGHGSVVYANDWGREWLSGATPLDRLSALAAREYDGGDAVARLRRAVDVGVSDQIEVPLRGEMPEPDWFQVSIRPLHAMPGLLAWSLEDITARKAINDILSQERQDLADFLDFMPTGIYSVDVDGKFHYANQRFVQWLGMSTDDILNVSLDDVIEGSARPEPDGEWHGVIRFKNTSGKTVEALVFQGTYDDAGTTRTRSIVLRDVKSDENSAGGQGKSQFRSLFDSAPVAITTVDPDGAIGDCNQSFAKLVARDREALVGNDLADFLIEDDRRALKSELDRVLTGQSDSAMVDARLIGARSTQVSIFLGPLSGPVAAAAGEIDGAVVHVIDTTEQKNLEVQFAQAQKMQAMGQLAGGVAHDFNNLLTAMIGFCDLLLQRHAAGDPSFADIMQIKQNSNRAANLVRQLLAFSRKQPLQPKELYCTDHLTELSHLLTRLIGESIEFKLIHGRDLGVVRVDPGQFDQIIINLAVNARDAMPGGGTLTIATDTKVFETPTQIGAEQIPPGRYVTISVADTGKGIAREDIGRIFEPFFSTKVETPGAGTGLGLATVYGIVRQTGGFILVDSAPCEGARFTIYLPRLSPEGAAENASELESAEDVSMPAPSVENPVALAGKISKALAAGRGEGDLSGSGKILLVEDEDAVRVFASRALKNKGYSILEARTGEQAMGILRDTDALDLLITDMMMPGMDGGTLARFVRVERPEVRIILISGYSEEVARGDVVDSPDIHFLPKPFSLGQLATKVKDVLAMPPSS